LKENPNKPQRYKGRDATGEYEGGRELGREGYLEGAKRAGGSGG